MSLDQPHRIKELAQILSFLGNEQRLNILRAITSREKFAREISEEVGISRPLVTIYLKQLEKIGLVVGNNRIAEDPPYLRRYYRAIPFDLVVNLDVIKNLNGERL